MKKILLLGGSAQQVIAIETAKRLGYYTVLCDFLTDNPGQYNADKFYLVSTTDKAAVHEVALKEQIDGVLAYASDPAAPTAAYIAGKMGLPGNPSEAVETLCNKDLFREFLKKNGFNTPASRGFTDRESAIESIGGFSLPVIIKPVDSSGSKGVTVLRDVEKTAEAVDFAFSFSRSNRIIIEEYIEKKHPYLIGGDIFVDDGKVVLWGLLNCHRDSRVNPLVPVGKSFPLSLEESDVRAVKATLQSMVTKLGIRFGAMNVELVVDKNDRVFPIDVGPRAGGNMIPDLLGMIFGIDVVEMAVQTAMGKKADCQPNEPEGCFATHNLHSDRDGFFESVVFSKEIEPFIVNKYIYKQRGDAVEYFDNAAKALGIVFMRFPDKNVMSDVLSAPGKWIDIKVR